MSSTSENRKLFSSVKYFTTGFRESNLESQFKQHGATRLFYLTEKTTHVICDDFTSNKSELEQAIEIYQTPIVTSAWIRACLESNQLLPVDSYNSADHVNEDKEQAEEDNSKQLFQSCTFVNANLLDEDHNRIYALVTYYGGRWIANLDSFVCTHVICASALSKKDRSGDANNNHENVDERLQDAYEIQSNKVRLITPDWILDCIQAENLLDETNYHPDLLDQCEDSMEIDNNHEDQSRASKTVTIIRTSLNQMTREREKESRI